MRWSARRRSCSPRPKAACCSKSTTRCDGSIAVSMAAARTAATRQRTHSLVRQLALALILGGALGNLVDRLSTGEVVDFILVGWRRWYWPVFNVADSAVSIGVALFAMTWMKGSEAHPAEPANPWA